MCDVQTPHCWAPLSESKQSLWHPSNEAPWWGLGVRGFGHLVIIPSLLWHCYVQIIAHQHSWCVQVALELSIPFPSPSVPQSFLGVVSIRGHSQWKYFVLMPSFSSCIVYKVLWAGTLEKYRAKPCLILPEGKYWGRELGSSEIYAVNAVNQIRMEGMILSKGQGFQYFAQCLNLSFHCSLNP